MVACDESSDTTGNVSFASSVTVTGDITVLGSQFIVNTEALKVEDPIIELGLVNSGGNLVAPTTDNNLDVGMIMHYYTGSTAKTVLYIGMTLYKSCSCIICYWEFKRNDRNCLRKLWSWWIMG